MLELRNISVRLQAHRATPCPELTDNKSKAEVMAGTEIRISLFAFFLPKIKCNRKSYKVQNKRLSVCPCFLTNPDFDTRNHNR